MEKLKQIKRLLNNFIGEFDISFVSDSERIAALRTMNSHNRWAFNEAARIIEIEKQDAQEKEWIKLFGSLDGYIPVVIASHSECMAYVKEHFGYAQLAKDGLFGIKVVYLK